MCTPFAHGLAGYAVLILGEPGLASNYRSNLTAMGAGFVFGSLADGDFLVAHFTNNPFLQHHFFSHSIPFVLFLGLITYLLLRALLKTRVLHTAMILTASYGSHLLLDYFTHDGSPPIGIPLFWPLTDKHFVAPVDIFLSIHRGSMDALFGAHNFQALFRETIILGPLAFAAYVNAKAQRRKVKN
jgi:membrane-bound metal-dependent hydrolase YbcI (DUF457 family)